MTLAEVNCAQLACLKCRNQTEEEVEDIAYRVAKLNAAVSFHTIARKIIYTPNGVRIQEPNRVYSQAWSDDHRQLINYMTYDITNIINILIEISMIINKINISERYRSSEAEN